MLVFKSFVFGCVCDCFAALLFWVWLRGGWLRGFVFGVLRVVFAWCLFGMALLVCFGVVVVWVICCFCCVR